MITDTKRLNKAFIIRKNNLIKIIYHAIKKKQTS